MTGVLKARMWLRACSFEVEVPPAEAGGVLGCCTFLV
jgi:hypothetical protein